MTTHYDEYPRYPLETLVDNGGDCEDTSIFLASIIDKMGYGVVLIVLPKHVGIGVKDGENIYGTYWEYKGGKYYYIETTGENWGIGELPDEYKNTSASIYQMIPVPIPDVVLSSMAKLNIEDNCLLYNALSPEA